MALVWHFKKRRSIFASDLKFEHWNAVISEYQEVTFQDSWKISMGYMYRGNPDAANYLGALSLRAGFHLQQYPLMIKETNLPIVGIVSVAFLCRCLITGRRLTFPIPLIALGTKQNGLILQRSQHIMFDVVIRDLWGIRRKFD